MKKALVFLIILFTKISFCQNFTVINVTKSFKGLTQEYQKYFNNNFSSLIETMNGVSGLDKSILPISLNITYENNQGSIQMIINYDSKIQNRLLPNMFKEQLQMAKEMGSDGFSIYLPDLLMQCLTEFKYNVLISSNFDDEIDKFQIKVRLKTTDGSWIQFYCKEYTNNNGTPRYSFEDFADIKYQANKMCRINALNSENIDDFKLWETGKGKNPDGTKNCNSYATMFFKNP